MTVEDRARFLIDKVKDSSPNTPSPRLLELVHRGKDNEILSDPLGRWIAQFVPDYSKTPARHDRDRQTGEREGWGLFQLFAYRELRLTAHYRGNCLRVTLYKPGNWENLFNTPPMPEHASICP